MPVLHDDQHGTAVATLAAATNAMRRAGLELASAHVGVIGSVRPARRSRACSARSAPNRCWLRHERRRDRAAARTRGEPAKDIADLMARVDLVVAVTGRKGLISPEWVRRGQESSRSAIPIRIRPKTPRRGRRVRRRRALVNNLLGFPGILRAAIDVRARRIDYSMYVAAAHAIAERARENELVPNPLRLDVHRAVARAVAEAAIKAGVARVVIRATTSSTSRCARQGDLSIT